MDLYAFLNPVQQTEEKDVVVSDRFKDRDGKVVPFRIKALSQGEIEDITLRSRKVKIVKGQQIESVDPVEMTNRIAVAATVNPPFASKELCDNYGVLDPLMVPGKMLRPGEFNRLIDEISALSGYNEDTTLQLENEIKNS